MILRSAPTWQPPSWRRLLAQAFRDPAELLAYLDLDPALLPAAQSAAPTFGFFVPQGFAARMRKGDANDPLLRQVLPLAEELIVTPGYSSDPVGDQAAIQLLGVLQKYAGRALVITTGACAVHCRYCFRRHYPYTEGQLSPTDLPAWQRWLAANPEVTEVILSGGDPLMLTDARLRQMSQMLAELPQITTLRLHSRVPVVLPERLDAELLRWVEALPQRLVLVIHANHPHELSPEVEAALAPWRLRGVTLLNQTVMLRGVNDDLATLTQLSQRLFACGVLPYYLHQLDPVQGAAHFAVPDLRAQQLVQSLAERLPGYLVPRLVREISGAKAKQAVQGLLE